MPSFSCLGRLRNTSYFCKVSLRIDCIELGRLDQAINGGGTRATSVGAGKQPVLAAKGDAAYHPLGGIVGHLDAPIVQIAGQRRPACDRVADGFG